MRFCYSVFHLRIWRTKENLISNGHFVWLESKQDAIASQIVTVGDNLFAQSEKGTKPVYGVSPAEVATWRNGAAMNAYLQQWLIPAVRDYSGGLTAARDELQIDKTVAPFVVPPFNPPAPPTPLAGAAPLDTDFLDWCDKRYQNMRLSGGLTDAAAKALGFLVPDEQSAPNPATMQPRVTSILTEAAGHTTVSVERQSQPQIHFRLTLDSGEVMNKTLPNSKASFVLPTDRVHHFEATAIYADRNGDDYGQWSDAKGETSEL